MTQQQRFEYEPIQVNALEFGGVADEKINEMAEEGWELKEKVDMDGTTVYLIFERPVE